VSDEHLKRMCGKPHPVSGFGCMSQRGHVPAWRHSLDDGQTWTDEVPQCTPKELLAVACPVCGADVESYCFVMRDGLLEVLLLPHHHEARFWKAKGAPPQGVN